MGNVTVISLGGSLISPTGGSSPGVIKNPPGAHEHASDGSATGGPAGAAGSAATSAPAGAAIRAAACPESPDQRAYGVDSKFLSEFKKIIEEYLFRDEKRKLIMVCGGGSLARDYQTAFRDVMGKAENDDLDWVGIAATRLNGELVRRIYRQWCIEDLVTDPTAVSIFAGRVMVAAGWKPGFSTDNDAVVLARRFSADTVVNLSNIAQVYSDDPKKNPSAKPLERITWKEFRSIVGDEWQPGKNAPFDPVAARAAAEARIRVIVAAGKDLENLRLILEGKAYAGTTIGPE
jgi:uridylate kinase